MFSAPVNRFMKPPAKSALPTPPKPSLASDMQGMWSWYWY